MSSVLVIFPMLVDVRGHTVQHTFYSRFRRHRIARQPSNRIRSPQRQTRRRSQAGRGGASCTLVHRTRSQRWSALNGLRLLTASSSPWAARCFAVSQSAIAPWSEARSNEPNGQGDLVYSTAYACLPCQHITTGVPGLQAISCR